VDDYFNGGGILNGKGQILWWDWTAQCRPNIETIWHWGVDVAYPRLSDWTRLYTRHCASSSLGLAQAVDESILCVRGGDATRPKLLCDFLLTLENVQPQQIGLHSPFYI